MTNDPKEDNPEQLSLLSPNPSAQKATAKLSDTENSSFTVVKRSGAIVPFHQKRIYRALESAFRDTKKIEKQQLLPEELATTVKTMAEEVVSQALTLATKNVSLTVEGIQDLIEVTLMKKGTGAYELLYSSVLLLLLAAFADLLDGAVARIIRAESEFGSMFDSLADAISFGVAPSVLFLKGLSLCHGSGLSFFAVVGAMLYTICGVLRLVRFNVRAHEAQQRKSSLMQYHKSFTGLPIPAAAAGAISVNLFFYSVFARNYLPFSHKIRAISLTCVMIALGYLMISRWKFPSLKTLHVRVPSFHLALLTVLLAISLSRPFRCSSPARK